MNITDLLFLWINKKNGFGKECKEDFEQIGEIHYPRCYKDKEESIKIGEYWYKEEYGLNMKLYRYNAAMKDYFKRYKFEGDVY